MQIETADADAEADAQKYLMLPPQAHVSKLGRDPTLKVKVYFLNPPTMM